MYSTVLSSSCVPISAYWLPLDYPRRFKNILQLNWNRKLLNYVSWSSSSLFSRYDVITCNMWTNRRVSTLKRFFNKFVIFVIFLNTQMDLFILKTDVEKFTSTNKKTLHLIFNTTDTATVYCTTTVSTDIRPQSTSTCRSSLKQLTSHSVNHNTFPCIFCSTPVGMIGSTSEDYLWRALQIHSSSTCIHVLTIS